jgi:hypothetical protein
MNAPALRDSYGAARALVKTRHRRAYDYDEKRRLFVYRDVDLAGALVKDGRGDEQVEAVWNLLTNTGRVQAHTQCYGTTSLLTNGFNWIGLTNDATSPAATGTSLTSEIAANGLTRAQGTVTLASGSGNQTTVDKTFTASGTQSCQQAALFTAASVGVMNHWASFTQRNLINTDTIQVTFTITLG